MNLFKTTFIHLTVILVLFTITDQFSLRAKRQETENPSETDYAGPIDESLKLDEPPVNDETELANIENDVQSTPDDEIVVSTPPTDEKTVEPSDETSENNEELKETDKEENLEENSGEKENHEENSGMIEDAKNETIKTSEDQDVETSEPNTDLSNETENGNQTQNISSSDESNELTETSEMIQDIKENDDAENSESSNTDDSESTSTQENITEETIGDSEVTETSNESIDTDDSESTSTQENITEETSGDSEITETSTQENSTEETSGDSGVTETSTESIDTDDSEATSTQENITEETSGDSEITDVNENSEDTTTKENESIETDEETTSAFTQKTTIASENTDSTAHHENYDHFVDDPSEDQLLESNRIANDYENEITTTSTTTISSTTTKKEKATVWFKPTKSRVNDSYNDESLISANCPSLNCEFGYKTDLYGNPICSCFNPCHEKKCGANVCKIEKLSESKFIGACYDPTKIERPLHCHLPLATGSCKNYTSRFYFNSFSQKCVHFVYTGCDGNQNNFDTWEKCEMECNTCSLPAIRGPCKGNIIRYHYDPLRRECVAFSWGGCKGNENNFQTRKHCEDSCIFRKEGALFLHGMPVRVIRKYHREQDEAKSLN